MIIHAPELRIENGHAVLSARIEADSAQSRLPAELWFRVPESQRDYLSRQPEPFVIGLIAIAMRLGEDVQVHGPLSPRLAYGLKEYQRILQLWEPRLFHAVAVESQSYTATPSAQGAVAAAFSGGADSFYSVWSHLPRNEPLSEFQVTHALFGQGVDFSVKREALYQSLREIYAPELAAEGVTLLGMATNLLDFGSVLKQHYHVNLIPIALAHAFGGLLNRFYMPASYCYPDLSKSGSHFLTDHLHSTESLDIVHDGGRVTRFTKLNSMADWSMAQRTLRVCWISGHAERGIVNDGVCMKCVRNMTLLEAAGARDRFITLPNTLTPRKIRGLKIEGLTWKMEAWEAIQVAKSRGNRALVFNLRFALLRSHVLFAAKKLVPFKVKLQFVRQERRKQVREFPKEGFPNETRPQP